MEGDDNMKKKLSKAAMQGIQTSFLQTRSSLASFLGQMFKGKRKMYEVFGYANSITYRESVGRYRRQDIAARIVEAPANALWANPPTITTSSDAWNKAWEKMVLRQNLWPTVSRADKMAGMGVYSVLVVGLARGGNLAQPITPTAGREVIYLQPYGASATEIDSLVIDNTNPRFNLPEKYKIKPSLDSETVSIRGSAQTFEVHASRVLHIGENYLTDEVFGNPRIERVWNLLDDLLKVAGGTAETFWLTANRGLQIDVDKEMELSDDDANDLSDEIEEYQHQLRRFIRTRGVKVNVLGSDIPNPKDVFSMLMSMISGATGIPKRILIGSEAGQLASEQDRNNWAERIEERQVNFGEPVIIWPLIRLLTNAGVLPVVEDDDVTIAWPDAFRSTPFERAQTSAHRARSAVNLAKSLIDAPTLLDTAEARGILELDPDVVIKAPAGSEVADEESTEGTGEAESTAEDSE